MLLYAPQVPSFKVGRTSCATAASGAAMDRDRGVLGLKYSLARFSSRLEARRARDGGDVRRWGWRRGAEENRTDVLAGAGRFKLRQLRQLRRPASRAIPANAISTSSLGHIELQCPIDCHSK